MKQKMTLAAAAAIVGLGIASAAQAVTFTFSDSRESTLPRDFDPAPRLPGLTAGDAVLRNATLGLSAPGRVTFTYAASESGYTNQFLVNGGLAFDTRSSGQAPVALSFGAGTLPFAFRTVDPAQTVANGASNSFFGSIALFRLSATSIYALFNDSSRSDKDYDDMVVRLDVAPVPLPAAAWMLLAGLGGLGLLKRRQPRVA